MSCSGEGCNSIYIQNKKYNLCSDCVFKKNHGGKSQQEVYAERATNKLIQSTVKKFNIQPSYFVDSESEANAKNQDLAVEHEKRDLEKKKKPKSIRQVSKKQEPIERAYKLTCIDMDYTTEPVCTGCNRYQGGDIKLSHSHIISRKQCKEIGKPELISERKNITYHCLDFGENEGCHRKWENPKRRRELLDYQDNIKIVEELAPELLQHFL